MTWGIIVTGLVAVAGIAATFFAPTFSETRLSRRRDEREFRTATRLVGNELGRIRTRLGAMEHTKFVPSEFLSPSFDSSEFDNHKPLLAALLPDEDWRTVANAYRQLAATRLVLGEGGDISDTAVEHLRSDIGHVKSAEEVLRAAKPLT